MENALSLALSWMPEVDHYCGSKLFRGARFAIIYYMVISIVCVLKPLLFFVYHHDGDAIIMYIQCFFLYSATVFGFFTFYLSIPLARKIHKKVIPENAISLLFILFCLILGTVDIIWALLSFIRAFVDPGLLKVANVSNPFSGASYRGKYGRWRERERQRKERQWYLDHRNDAIGLVSSSTRDAIATAVYALLQLYAFYPLICLRSYLTEDEEDDD